MHYYPTHVHSARGGKVIVLICLAGCQSVRIFDICHSCGRPRTLYNLKPVKILTERQLVLSVDLDSIDMDGVPGNCCLQWHFLSSGILFVYFKDTDCELRTVGRLWTAGSNEDPKSFPRQSLDS